MADPLQKMSPVENTMIGIATGMVDVSMTQWLIYCKNQMQQNLKLQFNPSIMYRGYVVSIINASVLTGVQFPLTGFASKLITGGQSRQLSDIEKVGAGFFGGSVSGILCAPMELTMIQQQLYGTSLGATPAKIITETGIMGMFRGLAMSCGREGLFAAGMLGLGPVMRSYGANSLQLSDNGSKVFGAVSAGVTVATLSHPMDTIKTCQQGDILKNKYGDVRATATTLLKEAGIRRFFGGYTWRAGRTVLQCFIFDECKSFLSPLFFPHHFAISE